MTRFLVVFDVDSTLIEDEVIELLAEYSGVRDQVAEVTERAMRGELDFAESLRERVATLAGLPMDVFDRVASSVTPTTGVHELIAAIHSSGGRVGAVSGGFTQVLEPLAPQLGLDFHRANLLEVVDGRLTGKVTGPIVDKTAKANAPKEWAELLGVPLTRTIAVGDGANDLEMMSVAGLAVAFNAKPLVRENADLVIDRHDLAELITLF